MYVYCPAGLPVVILSASDEYVRLQVVLGFGACLVCMARMPAR